MEKAREQIDKQLLCIGRQIGQLEAKRGAATSSQKQDIDIQIRELERRSARLGDAYLANIATILDVDGLVRRLRAETKLMNDEADKMGGVVTLLKSGTAILGIAGSVISLLKTAPKKP
jgi:hypothetical protein